MLTADIEVLKVALSRKGRWRHKTDNGRNLHAATTAICRMRIVGKNNVDDEVYRRSRGIKGKRDEKEGVKKEKVLDDSVRM
jgi:hypothetical protein